MNSRSLKEQQTRSSYTYSFVWLFFLRIFWCDDVEGRRRQTKNRGFVVVVGWLLRSELRYGKEGQATTTETKQKQL